MTAVQESGAEGPLAVGCSWPSPPRPSGPVEPDYIYDMNRVRSETQHSITRKVPGRAAGVER